MRNEREKWMLATVIAGVVNACNAPFCSNGDEEEAVNEDPSYIDDLAQLIAERTSVFALEDVINVLESVFPYCEKHKQAGTGVYGRTPPIISFTDDPGNGDVEDENQHRYDR